MADIYELGMLIKDVYSLDMSTFEGRLKLQKTVYLLQSFGIDLGYRFGWYLRGPYCPDLTKDGFSLMSEKQNVPNITPRFQDKGDQARYDRFKGFMGNKKENADLLEIAASICFRRNDDGMDKDLALKLTEGKMPQFTKDDCETVWKELEGLEVVRE